MYNDEGEVSTTATNADDRHWAINDSRPVSDAADFMRFGKTS
jgi:hypothetical protein